MVKIKSPFINENDDFGDFEISHPLNDLYYLLMNQHPDKYNNLHITLFKMFFNFKYMNAKTIKYIKDNFLDTVIDVINKLTEKIEYKLNVEYTKDALEKNYDILGPYDNIDNFFVKKFNASNEYRNTLNIAQQLTIKRLFGKDMILHSSNDEYNYYYLDGDINEPVIAISKFHNYTPKNKIIHYSICRVKQIYDINKLDITDSKKLKKEIFKKYIKNKVKKNDSFNATLYPSKYNRLYITYKNYNELR